MQVNKEILLVLTTYKKPEITELCLDAISKLDLSNIDVAVVDDCSGDETENICNQYKVDHFISKSTGQGLTDSWNIGYKLFRDKEYQYVIIANNDILIPAGAIEQLVAVLDKWPSSVVVPLSTHHGSGHNKMQSIDTLFGPDEERNNPNQYQVVQDSLIDIKVTLIKSNNLYQLDPIRMKMFNGFFFMMNRKVIQYEREDGLLFNPEYINVGNEDNFNWAKLIPNDDYAMLCKTAFVFHFKGASITGDRKLANSENWKDLR